MSQPKPPRPVATVLGIFSLGLAALFLAQNPVEVAAKPPKGGGGGGEVPAGTIFYTDETDAYAMRADGSGKVLTVIPGDLSNRVYGSDPTFDRWSLQVQQVDDYPTQGFGIYELFAVRPIDVGDGIIEYDTVQLTALYPDYYVVDPSNQVPRWSNDGEDSFVSFRAHEFGVDENGKRFFVKNHLFRLNVSGLDIHLATEDLKISALDQRLISVVSSTSPNAITFQQHDFSGDATKVAYLEDDPGGSWRLMVADLTAGTKTPLPVSPYQFEWSPTQDRLVFALGGIKTCAADGGELQILLENTTQTSYAFPKWSPDGQHLVYTRIRKKAFNADDRFIERIPSSGGSPVLLSGDLNSKRVIGSSRWLSNGPGQP